jgi:hypothetical protein
VRERRVSWLLGDELCVGDSLRGQRLGPAETARPVAQAALMATSRPTTAFSPDGAPRLSYRFRVVGFIVSGARRASAPTPQRTARCHRRRRATRRRAAALVAFGLVQTRELIEAAPSARRSMRRSS